MELNFPKSADCQSFIYDLLITHCNEKMELKFLNQQIASPL